MIRTHTVVAGETLSALALRFYSDAELYRLIATASGIADPDVINVGQRLIFPDFTRYTAVAGDTLSALALRFYGDAELDWLIATASGIADPNSAQVDDLRLPRTRRQRQTLARRTAGSAVVRGRDDPNRQAIPPQFLPYTSSRRAATRCRHPGSEIGRVA